MSSRSSSPSSSRSSATPSPAVIPEKKKKSSTNTSKDKEKEKTLTTEQARNEGEDPNWAYKPPTGAVLVGPEEVYAGDFDWDRLKNDDDLELWLIRVPESVKPKHLENLKVDIPSTSKTTLVGNLKRKHTSYDVWSLGDDDDNETSYIGGEELKNLTCLLPKKRKGKLYPAPKPIARHLIVSVPPVTPTPDPEITTTTTQFKNPPRPVYPKEALKHRYIPFGSILTGPKNNSSVAMEVDAAEARPAPSSPKKKKAKETNVDNITQEAGEQDGDGKKSKGKKRKGESADMGEAPTKKSKKSKATQ